VTKLQAFKYEFRQIVEVLQGVSSVEFIGSIETGSYVSGSSDLDVFVHGHKIPRQSKKQAIALVRELSKKYELGLETTPKEFTITATTWLAPISTIPAGTARA